MMMSMQGNGSEENKPPGGKALSLNHPLDSEKVQDPDKQPSTASRQVQMQSWQDIVNKVNAQMGEEQVHNYPQSLSFNTRPKKETQNGNHLLANQQREVEHRITNPEEGKDGTDDEELEMDAGMIEREENSHSRKESIIQEPMLPDDAADPAQDPNNQGEDEFEEAELERPDFEEKAAGSDKPQKPNAPGKGEVKGKPWQDAAKPEKAREDPLDDYQEDQEQETEDQGGEVEDNDDLELDQEPKGRVDVTGGDGKKDDYY
uniref:Uncharacterized protein n=1 Tax=Sphenodon punctatus TaxID=8508 RepID=A0A8D0HKA4_SPHPU